VQLSRNRPGDIHVETAELAAFGAAERGIRGVDTDPYPAARAHSFERRLREKRIGENQNREDAGKHQTQHQGVLSSRPRFTTWRVNVRRESFP
jgi:hypothetical protein